MRCSCVCFTVYATQRTANFVALAILISTYQLVSDKLHAAAADVDGLCVCLPQLIAIYCHYCLALSRFLLKFVSAPRVLFYRVYLRGHP